MGLRDQCGGRNTNAATNAAAVPTTVSTQMASSGCRNAAFTILIAIATITVAKTAMRIISFTIITTTS